MRSLSQKIFLSLALLCAGWLPAQGQAQVSVGVYISSYPTTMVQIPGYPVYYDPYSSANYFFFDGLYWIYANDAWYQSSWYNGPWQEVDPYYVPEFLLRVPVRYYRQPPAYFRGWVYDEPPRWGYRWGGEWEYRRHGWNVWDRRVIVAPAPLPHYQRQFYGERYPRSYEQQRSLHVEQYRYAPQDRMTQQHYQSPAPQAARRDIMVTPTQPAQVPQQQPQTRREFSVTPTQPQVQQQPLQQPQQQQQQPSRNFSVTPIQPQVQQVAPAQPVQQRVVTQQPEVVRTAPPQQQQHQRSNQGNEGGGGGGGGEGGGRGNRR